MRTEIAALRGYFFVLFSGLLVLERLSLVKFFSVLLL